MIKLYQFPMSGNSHKVRLMLSLLQLPHEAINVSGLERQHKSPDFLALNPFGQVPVLVDGKVVVRDSQAILVYLAGTYGQERWWPKSPREMAEITAWLSTAANEVAQGPNLLRLHFRFGKVIQMSAARAVTGQLLGVVESRLAGHPWLVGRQASIADVAMYPYLALAPEGAVDLRPYPALRAWLDRIQQLPGYVGMHGMWLAAEPAADSTAAASPHSN